MSITIEDLEGHLEQFHKYDGYYMAVCPFHDDHTPSMRVWDTGYKCYSCGAFGGINKLYEKVSGNILPREKKYNPAAFIWKDWDKKFGSLKDISSVGHACLKKFESDQEYLKKRKIYEFMEEGRFGYLDGYYTFPILDAKKNVLGVIARASTSIQTKSNRYTVSPDCQVKWYCPNPALFHLSFEVYLPFGTIDAWSVYAAGYPSFTGISGQEIRPENMQDIIKVIYIIPDRGEHNNAIHLGSKLGWRGRVLFLEYPDGCKDVNDVHKNYGVDAVKTLIEKEKAKFNYD